MPPSIEMVLAVVNEIVVGQRQVTLDQLPDVDDLKRFLSLLPKNS